MADTRYKITRDDGEELGIYDRRDEAERVAEYDAQARGYRLKKWLSYQGGAQAMPTTSGRDVFGYKREDVPCE